MFNIAKNNKIQYIHPQTVYIKINENRWHWEDLDKDKWIVKTEQGYTLVIVMELRKLVGQSRVEFPQGYQFKIHAYNLVNPNNEFVRIDNHENKPPHYHIDSQEKSFTWISWEESKKLFYQLTCQRFGYFDWKY